MARKLLPLVFATAAAFALAASAQTPDHLVIPLSHPSQPVTLRMSLLSGSITVRGTNASSVIFDSQGGGESHRHERPAPPEAQGMHRLNANQGLTAEESNNVVQLHASIFSGGNFDIQVPLHTSVSLHSVNGGHIDVRGITGDINVDTLNGSIDLEQVSGSIVAHALNGRITAVIQQLNSSKPSSFSSMNGVIDVTLPADVHADLRMKTDHGNIYLDNGFAFQPSRTGPSSGERAANGMYKVKIDNTIYGKLNGGGPEIRFENFNGNIYVHKGH